MSGESARDPAAVADDLDTPVLLFDGVCNLCNSFVRFVVRFDAEGTFRFAPLQSAIGEELLARYDLEPDDETFDTVVLVEDGEAYTRSTAALRVARRLDGPWPLLYPLVYLPRRLRDGIYDLVAKYRYRVFGSKDECPMPDPELRERFAERSFD
ncbi:thiol-disulfide oxidoreductase DCC family protein [Halorientalis brevis]|uniref:Thiol-disulfide oxidoreductase DCC family protein n=1 Tax=Halorientalis brevis TaxID=1126241 RepID=A0ABD6C7X0_9EURY|nr:thiol-disulfide oxidoreductase DCC family protein [Halorientalis brevis]